MIIAADPSRPMPEPEPTFIKISDDDRKQFEAMGLARLKQLSAMPGSPYPNMPAVVGWIAEQEEIAATQQAALARSAKDAAWEAAHHARSAVLIAKWALAISVLASLAAFLSAWLQTHPQYSPIPVQPPASNQEPF
jgi:hypothetical protein